MSRIDEMIYHLDMMAKNFQHNVGTTLQNVEGKERSCCTFCGHCPDAEAEWLRAIRDELRANTTPKRKLAQAPKSTKKEG